MSSKMDGAAQRAERMARLYRFTLQTGMTEATRSLIKGLLLAELGGDEAGVPATPMPGIQADAGANDNDDVSAETEGGDGDSGPMSRSSERQRAAGAERLEAKPGAPARAGGAVSSPAAGSRTVGVAKGAALLARPSQGQSREPASPATRKTNHNQESPQPRSPVPAVSGASQAGTAGAEERATERRAAGVPVVGGAERGAPAKSALNLERRLRQLVEADAGWDLLAPLALGLYELRGDPATAARAVELAFLHATTDQLEDLIGMFKERARGFYRHMHAAVRAHVVARLWSEGAGDPLATLLIHDRDQDYLQPIERLFVHERMAGGADPGASYLYFRRYCRDLLAAAADLGSHFGVTLPAFLLRVGRTAAGLGYDSDARELLEQIAEGTPERDEALHLLLGVTVERNKARRGHYAGLLAAQANPDERLKLLSEFFTATRGLGTFRDRDRPALTEVLDDALKEPLAPLGEAPELWAALSDMLVANRDLEASLPHVFEVFRAHACTFERPVLDAALWQGPLNMYAHAPRDCYYRGVALLHQYVTCGVAGEAALWEAKEQVAAAKRVTSYRLPFEWRDLYKAAFAWVAKNHYHLEADRVRLLQQMRIAVDAEVVAVTDIEDYVAHAEAPPVGVLTVLQALAGARNAPALETRVILRRAAESHLTNADLARIWQLANERKESDLAWRAATVLSARRALCAPVRHAWEICGEKRAAYMFQTPPKVVVDRCLIGVQPRFARLAYACLVVGPVLPELLALLDPGAAAMRVKAAPADSLEAKVDRALSGIPWLPGPRRRFRFSFEAAAGGGALPAFMQVLPPNPWSFTVARLAERLGINAWGWKLSRLHTQIIDLIPRLASRQDLRRHSGRVATWLKDLTPEQRAAWQDLATLSRSVADDRAAEALAGFLCRLATVLMQNHIMALTSLQQMRAPAAVLWDLENWLLSDAYTALRQQLGTANRVLVPNTLQRLGTIVEA